MHNNKALMTSTCT